MSKNKSCVVLFSGGTDSTLTAALCEKLYDKVYLVTYSRFGIASVENSKVNAQMLIDKFGADRFEHHLINIDNLFKHVSYEKYFKNLFKHKFMNLSTCGLCKLSMHIRTIKFCEDNKIEHVADGANQGMTMFPAQMKSVISEIQKMYEEFGIIYSNPVFEYHAPDEGGFVEMENMNLVHAPLEKKRDPSKEEKEKTAGQVLYEMGLAPMPNVKGSKYDRDRQPRCFQFILFKIFAQKYYLEDHDYEDYVRDTNSFFKDKIEMAKEVLKDKDNKFKRIFS